MSFLCSIDRSTIGTSICKAARQMLTPLYSVEGSQSWNSPNVRCAPHQRHQSHLRSSPAEIDAWFVTALVRAGHCRRHTAHETRAWPLQAPRNSCRQTDFRRQGSQPFQRQRYQHTKAFQEPAPDPDPEPTTKEALLALVDQYEDVSPRDHLPLLGRTRLYPSGSESLFHVSDNPEDSEWPSDKYVWPAQGEHQKIVEQLKQCLEDGTGHAEYVYWLYKSLPAPRIPYLSASHRHRLLRTLGVVERKDEHSMLRYLSVVDDMKICSIALNIAEWNNAMSFAGRYVAKTTEAEVESTLRLWKEMEHVAGVQSNSATFNILFDVATKAGKFKLAEMIYREMENRGLAFNRYHHVSLIHLHGLRGDGEGARKAYRDLVEAGEIVDTVVLNCMMSALIRAGEPQAAEQVYARMKTLHNKRIPRQLPPRAYEKRREVNKALVKMGQLGKRDLAARQKFQKSSPIAPDVQTYRILINYLAVKAGDLEKTTALIDEMRWFNVPLQGSIFLSIFKGFAAHGGIRYSPWTEDRLERVWRAYIQAAETDGDELYMGKWIVIWALKAFAKCSGKTRTLQVWAEIREKWKHTDDELDHVTKTLQNLAEPEGSSI